MSADAPASDKSPAFEDRSGYYREIAAEFLRLRGGAFILSPLDVALVADWEAKRIPLDAVIEGMRRAYAALRERGGAKPRALSFCRREVEREARQVADRRVGRAAPAAEVVGSRLEKARKARLEAARFLGGPASDVSGLAEKIRLSLETLTSSAPDEESLERIDREVDELLWESATLAEREAALREAVDDETRRAAASPRARGGGRGNVAAEPRARVRLAKERRRLLGVPYVSLYYY